MVKRKKLLAVVLTMLLIFGMSIITYAHDIPDMSRLGSIEITMHMGKQPVGGGTLTAYRVGEIQENNGDYGFEPAGEFAGCEKPLEDIQNPSLARELEKYAKDYKCTGITKHVSEDGNVVFSDLELGLYLIIQQKAADGYYKADPFLVSLPYMENGRYNYKVDASPKVETEKKPQTSTVPPRPKGSRLPQTGQMNWPIPILAVAGLTLFAVGWNLCYGKRKNNEK